VPTNPKGDSRRRPAARLAGFREANDRIANSAEKGSTIFVCECGSQECLSTLELSVSEYETIRAKPTWALVMPGHELGDVERVVKEGAGFQVVERLLLASAN
jgi:hypothetical protein